LVIVIFSQANITYFYELIVFFDKVIQVAYSLSIFIPAILNEKNKY